MVSASGPFDRFQVGHSIAFEDSLYAAFPGALDLPKQIYLRGSIVVAAPFTDYRILPTLSLLRTRLDSYANQFGGVGEYANWRGQCTLDFEPWSSATPPSPTTLGDVVAACVAAIQLLRQAMPLAKIGMWGIPTSAIVESGGSVEYPASAYNAVWAELDYQEPHIYTQTTSYTAGFENTSTNRINEAKLSGLPIRPSWFDMSVGGATPNVRWPTSDWIKVAKLCKSLGCFGMTWWQAFGFGGVYYPADYWQEWQIGAAALKSCNNRAYARQGPSRSGKVFH